MSDKNLFSDFQLGPNLLKNRVVMAPMTRDRAEPNGNLASDLAAEYYRQRASAGLIITEGSQTAAEGQGYPTTPGIHSKEQANAWKKITSGVHEEGGKIFLQLWHVGRVSHSLYQPGGKLPVAPSAIAIAGQLYTPQGMKPFETPRALETSEIPQVVDQFRNGAQNALEAGFDGVEIHGANGYIIDQFLQTGTNQRTDEYGGSVENRVRFLVEVTKAVVGVWGKERVGVRLSPNGTFNSMTDANHEETFVHALRELDKIGVVYAHLRRGTVLDRKHGRKPVPMETFRAAFKGAIILNDGFDRAQADEAIAKGTADLVAFGSLFVSNPDLPYRLQTGAALTKPDASTFYTPGPKGYVDYPTLTKSH